ncbi:multidrug ABC transporter ATP-binding protein [Thermocladium modestius]|uniref:Multidrug ABC transporter ATP-binding protein n=1 Tax=Thermocladium modestius TaxID=62609 RepID=A0A830GXD7_9CREN|nr:ABC transporter permease [Thermocladium modestius]GGP21201.1 multidrug ABC transporter ATP-binding protein [Thermocladium modestius]
MRPGNVYAVAKYIILSSRAWIYAALGFTLMFPILWLLLLKMVGNPIYVEYFIVGTVVNTSFGIPFIGASQDISMFKRETIYSMLFANGADHFDIALGYIIQVVALSTPSIVALLALAVIMMGIRYGVIQITLAVAAAILISLASALLGYALGVGVRNYRVVNQVSQIVPWPLLLLAPVYYPITILPTTLRYVALILPTTYMAFTVEGALNLNLSTLAMGLLGILAYSSASVLITRYAIARGEVNG